MAALPAPSDDDILVESYYERFEALQEMFPKSVRNFTSSAVSFGWATFGFAKQATWVVATTALIMIMPFIIEKERVDQEKTQIAQQRQMLLGPGASQTHH